MQSSGILKPILLVLMAFGQRSPTSAQPRSEIQLAPFNTLHRTSEGRISIRSNDEFGPVQQESARLCDLDPATLVVDLEKHMMYVDCGEEHPRCVQRELFLTSTVVRTERLAFPLRSDQGPGPDPAGVVAEWIAVAHGPRSVPLSTAETSDAPHRMKQQ